MSNEILTSFFEMYARVSMGSDPRALASHYADDFLVSGPTGSAVFQNDEPFLAWLSELHDFNQQVGMQSLEVLSVHDTPINDHHAFARVKWSAKFARTGDEGISFDISYLLRLIDGQPLILAYVSHEDQEKVMKARGII